VVASSHAAPAPALESFPFDSDVVAHNGTTGALCILNGTAGEYLVLVADGHGMTAAADIIAARYGVAANRVASDLADLQAALTRAGLLGPAAAGEPEAPSPAAEPEAAALPPDLAEPAFDAIVSCGGAALRLTCEEPALAALLAEVMRPAVSGAPPPAAGAIELAGGEGDYRCWADRRLLWACGPRPLARRNVAARGDRAHAAGPPGGDPARLCGPRRRPRLGAGRR
jgi:hypothetical protein